MKKHLNAYCQWHRIDPNVIETISDDDTEDTMPNILDFLGLPLLNVPAVTPNPPPAVSCLEHPATITAMQPGPQTSLPSLPNLAHLVPQILPSQSTMGPNWVGVLVGTLHAPVLLHAPHDSAFAQSKLAVNWVAFGPASLDANVKVNDHELVPTAIPDALCMMMHLKLFIPLSMLTTASLPYPL